MSKRETKIVRIKVVVSDTTTYHGKEYTL